MTRYDPHPLIPGTHHVCPDPECPEKLRHIRDEVSEKLEYIPAHFVVNQYVRPQYGCTCCQRVVGGVMPAQMSICQSAPWPDGVVLSA